MPIARKPKALYLSKNIAQLQAQADQVDKLISDSKTQQLVVSVDRLQSQGFKSIQEGDQEKAYVAFYRLTKTLLAVSQKPDFKQHEEYLNRIFPKTKLARVMNKLDELTTILAERYDKQYPEFSEKALKEKLSAGKIKDIKPLNGVRQDSPLPNDAPSPPEKADKPAEEPPIGSLKVLDLRSLIEQQSTRLLIIDCRSLSSYEKSHVNHPNCISIPDSILEKGQSANKLTEKLQAIVDDHSQRQLDLWNTREKFDRIILYDWNSSYDSRDPDSPISVLHDAMMKWDFARKYPRAAEIVTGGFREILYKYPTLLTNPASGTHDDPERFMSDVGSARTVPELSSISYPNFENDDDLVARANKLRLGDSSESMKTSNSTTVSIVNNNVPAARPNSSIITPDRSKKPTKAVLPKDTAPAATSDAIESSHIEIEPAALGNKDQDGMDRRHSGAPVNNAPDVPSQSQNATIVPDRNAKPPRKLNVDPNVNNTGSPVMQNGHYAEEETDLSPPKSPEGIRRPSFASLKNGSRKSEASSAKTNDVDAKSYGFQPIRDEPSGFMNGDLGDKSMKSTMKRSRSIPNLKKTGEEEDLARVPRSEPKPTFERGLKPVVNNKSFEAYAGRRRDFDIVSSSTRCVTGLKNLGNTCYMNSVLQCLLSTPQLVDYFLGAPNNAYGYRRDINYQSKTKGHTTEEFAALIREISNGHRSIAAKDFVSTTVKLMPKEKFGEQQDCHEFLLALINSLNDELNKIRVSTPLKEQNNDNLSDEVAAVRAWESFRSLNQSILIDLFWGQQKSCVTCLSCGKRSVTFETFSILSIPIRSAKRCDIKSCLDLYTTEEEIPEYQCVHCKRKVRATKKLDLWKLPMYLIIQFQRFYYDGFWKKKVTEIDFPLENFDLVPYVKGGGNNRYDLYGVSNHMGSMEGGHYTAYCRRRGNWYEFDDSTVRQLGRKQDIVTQNGYIIFYQRCPYSPY